ncbi:plasmid mobilization relaxosome protein MobC [uncultured Enterocloster sp.]|uniref:plasmid mobilization relaxosome protein MobC n=1 Tax=Clostridia TaxID=186801 RepID=UPI0009D6BA07
MHIRSREGLLRYCSNNLNQYAKRANETGSIYTEDIKDLQNRQNEIREITKEILARLATIQ